MTSAADHTLRPESLWRGIRFSDGEYADRVRRFKAALIREKLDVAVLSDERTTWYLSGFGDVVRIGSRARPRVLVVPVDGDPVFFVHESTAVTVREMVWFEDIRTYAELGGAPIAAIASVLASRSGGAVGLELAGQLRPELTAAEIIALREELAPRAVGDVASAVWATRLTKSEAEAARLRAACDLTSRAYAHVFHELHVGMTERDVKRAVADAIVREGADGAWSIAVAGRGDYVRVDGVSRERPIQNGELVFIDAGANVGGYWADFSRAGVVGGPTSEQRAFQEQIAEATRAGVEAIRPGARLSDVARASSAVMQRYGLEFSSRAGRIGHGLGMVVTEPPDVAERERSMIEPGMVLTIEPGVIRESGIFHCEENVLVTESGYEVLSLAPWELQTI